MSECILVVEDEPVILTAVKDALEAVDYQVGIAKDGPSALELWRSRTWQLVILDVMLPGVDGFDVLARLRAEGDRTPVLMLTARGTEDDRVRGLKLGADDYLTKPFGVREMLARVESLLRRQRWENAPPPRLTCGRVTIDLERLEARIGDEVQALTGKEGDILRYLVRHRDRVVSKREFLTQVWGYPDVELETRTVENTIVYLRKKIEEDPKEPRLVMTIRGEGWKLGKEVGWAESASSS